MDTCKIITLMKSVRNTFFIWSIYVQTGTKFER